VRRSIDVRALSEDGGGIPRQNLEFPGVELLHHPEPAKLPFDAVEEAVMVCVSSDKPVAADPIERLDRLDDVDGKRKACDPGPARLLVRQIEPGRRSVANAGLCAQVVHHTRQQVWFLAHQIEVPHLPTGVAWQG
jgi:hypothetical protein